MKQVRQGDVFLQEVSSLPEKAVKRSNNTVAYGEVTGHHHTFDTEVVVTYESEGDVYVALTEPTVLTHQEHKYIEVEPAVYKVIKQREYSPSENRKVLD